MISKIKELFGKSKKYLKEVTDETKKVSWAGKKEIFGSTLIIIITVIIVAAYVGVIDVVMNNSLKFILTGFGR